MNERLYSVEVSLEGTVVLKENLFGNKENFENYYSKKFPGYDVKITQG